MRFVIVTGMSGAGKSSALKTLEDAGYFCVDNLPVALLDKFADMLLDETAKIENVALGIDIRNGRGIGELAHKLKEIEAAGIKCEILYLNDSKKLSAAKREELYDEIMEKAVAAAVGMASPARIDEINILQATYEAMREAISKLAVEPGILLNDAVTIPEMIIPQVPIIKGDAKSVSIAAASILAKVTRDRLMVEYDKVMPEYGFAGHKGYGSKEHIEAIKKYGPTPIHRKTFIKKFI